MVAESHFGRTDANNGSVRLEELVYGETLLEADDLGE